VSDADLDDHFRPALDYWRAGPEVKLLLPLLAQQRARKLLMRILVPRLRPLDDATEAARRVLVGYLQAQAVKLLVRIGEPGGPPWEICHRLTPEELAKRADRALADLQPEGV
jgi:hypothetical protein